MRKTTWNTYATTCYMYDVANDQASAGDLHLHQIRWHRQHGWQTRICQSNGRHSAYGAVSPAEDAEGAAMFATAQQEDE